MIAHLHCCFIAFRQSIPFLKIPGPTALESFSLELFAIHLLNAYLAVIPMACYAISSSISLHISPSDFSIYLSKFVPPLQLLFTRIHAQGALINHEAVLSVLASQLVYQSSVIEGEGEGELTEDDCYLSYLPLAHIFDRSVGF
jgi:hypothetical protein